MATYIGLYSCLLLVTFTVGIGLCSPSNEEFESQIDDTKLIEKSLCNTTVDHPNGKFEFNQNTPHYSCIINISITVANKTKDPPKIYLFFEKLLLDGGDKVIVKDADVPVNATETEIPRQAESLLLLTEDKNIIIEFETSERDVKREFAFSYLVAPTCTITVDNDIDVITHPIFASNVPNNTVTTCTFNYVKPVNSDITYAFSFDSFNLTDPSTISVKGAQEIDPMTFTSKEIPNDFMSDPSKQLEVIITSHAHDTSQFALRRHVVYTPCSKYTGFQGKTVVNMIHAPDLLEQDIPIECRWHFKSTQGDALGFKFDSFNFQSAYDTVVLTNGAKTTAPAFFVASNVNKDLSLASVIRTSLSEMMVSFKPVSFASNISFTVTSGPGKYMYGNGTVPAVSLNEPSTMFLFEVPEGQNVFLDLEKATFPPTTFVEIYEDFTMSKKVATLRGKVWYPIVSSTSKMLVAVIGTGSTFQADSKGLALGCVHMSSGKSDNYVLAGNCNSTCSWVIPPTNSTDELVLHFQYLALEKDDFIEVLKLDEKKTLIAKITSTSDSHIPPWSLDALVGALVKMSRGPCPKKEQDVMLVAHTNYLPGCSKNYILDSQQEVEITSPRFPDTYPVLTRCQMKVTKTGAKTKFLHAKFENVQLADNHCIDIVVINNGSRSTPIHVTGNQLPADIVTTGEIEYTFNAENKSTIGNITLYDSKQGFAVHVTALDCGGYVTVKNSTLTFPANSTKCMFMVTVPEKEKDGSVNIILFKTKKDKTENFDFHVHDGSSVRNVTITNITEGIETWSKTNSLIFEYAQKDSSKPSGALTIDYRTHTCNETCENGLCMHPDWKCDTHNDCGDNSDEMHCGYPPPPPTPTPTPAGEKKAGIAPATFGVCIVMFFAFGVAVTLIVPILVQKYRNRYERFNDLSVIE